MVHRKMSKVKRRVPSDEVVLVVVVVVVVVVEDEVALGLVEGERSGTENFACERFVCSLLARKVSAGAPAMGFYIVEKNIKKRQKTKKTSFPRDEKSEMTVETRKRSPRKCQEHSRRFKKPVESTFENITL